jgi:hypothetical protein
MPARFERDINRTEKDMGAGRLDIANRGRGRAGRAGQNKKRLQVEEQICCGDYPDCGCPSIK